MCTHLDCQEGISVSGENQDVKTYDAAEDVALVGVFVPHSEVDEDRGFILLNGITEAT